MNQTTKNTIIVAVLALIIGLGSGYFLFSGPSHVAETTHTHESAAEEWTCSMHPQIRQPEAGACPICGMDLIPVGNEDSDDPLEIRMSPSAIRLASIQTETVSRQQPIKKVRLDGKIQADERLISSQVSHISGRIEQLRINTTGEYVRKGQTIAYIYSPELVTAQEELFEAYKLKDSNPLLYQAARDKLKNWKLTGKQIDSILESGRPSENFPILSDINGVVLNRRVNLGDHVMQGAPLFEIADLSRIWVLFDVHESNIPWVKVGDEIEYTIQSLPGRAFSGKISFIDPVINPSTRVARARVESTNKSLELKPEMFVSGQLSSQFSKDQPQQVVIPKSAIMWTGQKSVVYVQVSNQNGLSFKMREVTLGPSLGDSYVVMAGLDEGEKIAANGTFSIDAAAQLSGKPSMMSLTDDQSEYPESANISTEVFTSKNGFTEQLKALFEAYLPIKDALVSSNVRQTIHATASFISVLEQIDMKLTTGAGHETWMADQKILSETIQYIHSSTDLEAMRGAFSVLSDQLYQSLTKFEVQGTNGYQQYCPMAFDNTGAYWLSDSDEILNPYFGDMMLTCGNVENELN